ncbi:MAG: trehalose-phosphatase [Bryobacteraceae bacterium]
MKYLLSLASRPVVTRLAQERTLCAFDFDGTLSPIADRPDRAGMRVRTRNLLRRLAALYPCVIISGRARADVLGKLSGVNVARVIGNHGAEAEATRKSHRRVERWKAVLELELGPMPGLWVEDKGYSLAVHYRQSTQKAEARRRILAATRSLKRVRVFGGKQVVNLVADEAPHKGDALAAERDRLGCNWVLYVGDDENDENAFALGGNIVPVRIGRKQRSHARYYLRTQAEIDELLDLLVRLRKPKPVAPV